MAITCLLLLGFVHSMKLSHFSHAYFADKDELSLILGLGIGLPLAIFVLVLIVVIAVCLNTGNRSAIAYSFTFYQISQFECNDIFLCRYWLARYSNSNLTLIVPSLCQRADFKAQ